ncbi:MAG: methylmalonyl-CoA mutase small subunit [Rhizobiales bacterium]|nr:methylmalonyl-CoA mutase small subunit [Hyphomicrobiales bacterium]
MSDLPLAADFPAINEEEWRERVARVLKGASFDTLVTKSADGIDIQPLYPPSHDTGPISRGRIDAAAPAWHIVQRADIPDPAKANDQILQDLEGGASAIALVMPQSVSAGEHGLAVAGPEDLKRLLERVELDLIGLRLDAGRHGLWMTPLLLSLYQERNLDPKACDLKLGIDPVGRFAHTGAMLAEPAMSARMADLLQMVEDARFEGPVFAADTRVYHMAGATPAQELGIALATVVQYLRALESKGVDLKVAASRLGMLLTSNADLFMSIAKLRAARLVWARLLEAMELPASDISIDVETSLQMMARRDVHVNMLRVGTAVLAAGIGGANSVTALPMTAACGLADRFARRMARNTQLILQEESGIGRTMDAAAGSGYVETLTSDLAAAAWRVFQDIEGKGGMIAALQSGDIAKRLAGSHQAHAKQIGRRQLGLTGVTEFPNLHDTPPDVLDMPLPGDWTPPVAAGQDDQLASCSPLQQTRDAQAFEQMRERSEAAGPAAKVFLATLGTLPDFTARAMWTRNLFAVAGIQTTEAQGFATPVDAAEGFTSSGASLACICSSDPVYGALAVDTVKALKQAGAAYVYLSGDPSDLRDALVGAGVDDVLKAGMDIRPMLETALARLGVAET